MDHHIRVLLFICIFLFFSESSVFANSECRVIWNQIKLSGSLRSEYSQLDGLCGEEFRKRLRNVISTNRRHSYSESRFFMFAELDNYNGTVCGVYTNKCIRTNSIPNHKIMNCEHSWPQSHGATGIARVDVHHLYPSDSRMNSRRGNLPFCEVLYPTYNKYGSQLGDSELGTKCFEPPDYHKGNLARSMFYFAVRYDYDIDEEQESFFRMWSEFDRIDQTENNRNNLIFGFQNNRNPFVDHPLFYKLIFDF